jgi:hypothetical protein
MPQSAINGDADGLDLDVVEEAVLSKLATNTRLLKASKRLRRVEFVVAIDPHGSRAQVASDTQSLANVSGANAGRKTVPVQMLQK